ncbi:MAG: hypothetical protein B6D37_05465 [Sphingobacteriales bacterium UTBCD1]|nr:MAG: hypothetical protein B6D37_05465 [Sphingobacteriales bacterium UTBCD1]
MANNSNDITGYILAGGKSSRMGTDKGLLTFHGEPLVLRIIKQLQESLNKVVIVSDNEAYKYFGLEVTSDLVKEMGPAGGIYTALHHSRSNRVFITSCDMPFITSGGVRFIVQEAIHSQITLPLYEGKVQPLFGIYSRNCISGWKQLIDRGIIKLQKMITHFNLKQIDTDQNVLFNNSFFTNINDKTDLDMALKISGYGN